MHYLAIIEQQAGTLYGGWFPDCPGAASAGETMEACMDSAHASLQAWAADALANGEELPLARSWDEIEQDPRVSAAIARGALAVAVRLD